MPPCIWTFLSNLSNNEFFSILLGERVAESPKVPGDWRGAVGAH